MPEVVGSNVGHPGTGEDFYQVVEGYVPEIDLQTQQALSNFISGGINIIKEQKDGCEFVRIAGSSPILNQIENIRKDSVLKALFLFETMEQDVDNLKN